MKKVIIIIVCILVIIGIGFGIYVHVNKPKSIKLTSEEINNYNKTTTEFLNSVNNNDYKEYVTLTGPEMGTQKGFETVENFTNNNLGKLKDLTYVEAFNIKGDNLIIYNGNFSKNNFKFDITLNKDNKILGFREA